MQRRLVQIKKAIVLPATLARKFNYEHSYLLANKQFAYGAQYDVNQRLVIIDALDIPKDVELQINNYAIFEHHRYTVKMVERFEHRMGFLLTLNETAGASPYDIIPLFVESNFRIGQAVSTS